MTIDSTIIKSALVSAVLMAILAVALEILQVGDIFKLNWQILANAGALAFLTALVSLIKQVLTNQTTGIFAGIARIK